MPTWASTLFAGIPLPTTRGISRLPFYPCSHGDSRPEISGVSSSAKAAWGGGGQSQVSEGGGAAGARETGQGTASQRGAPGKGRTAGTTQAWGARVSEHA